MSRRGSASRLFWSALLDCPKAPVTKTAKTKNAAIIFSFFYDQYVFAMTGPRMLVFCIFIAKQ
jgi:hypothetical protein